MKTISIFAGLAMFSAPLYAQQDASIGAIPQITIASHAEVKAVPDRATISISVQTRSETAAAAASENAKKQTAVITGLKALGIDQKDITTAGYTIYPEQRYEPNKEPVIVGYTVTNTLSVDLKSVSLVGPAIDASLSKGANMVNSLQFYSSNSETARQQAIAMAVRKARSDADATAQAAGGEIVGLLEVTVGAYYPPPPRPLEMKVRGAVASADVGTPITPGEQAISVDIGTRWQFRAK